MIMIITTTIIIIIIDCFSDEARSVLDQPPSLNIGYFLLTTH